MAGLYDLLIEQGATFERVLTWFNSDGSVVNLTGYTARMKIKDGEGNLVVSLTTTPTANGDVITLGGTAGTIDIYISDETTTAMRFGAGRYDLELEVGGRPARLIKGIVQLDNETTT